MKNAWSLDKSLIPKRIINLYRLALLKKIRAVNRFRSRKKVFTEIYENNKWGSTKGQYYSGDGSGDFYAMPYAEIVRDFILKENIRQITDLGCGDFKVGELLQIEGVNYCGVDIVDALVERNHRLYGSPNISFYCLDIVTDELPDSELCLIRQVLQHLSNEEIQIVLKKLEKYKFVIITEHYPSPKRRPIVNKNKPHGADVRIYDNSAIYLDKHPFNIPIKALLLDIPVKSPLVYNGETIKTFLVENKK